MAAVFTNDNAQFHAGGAPVPLSEESIEIHSRVRPTIYGDLQVVSKAPFAVWNP